MGCPTFLWGCGKRPQVPRSPSGVTHKAQLGSSILVLAPWGPSAAAHHQASHSTLWTLSNPFLISLRGTKPKSPPKASPALARSIFPWDTWILTNPHFPHPPPPPHLLSLHLGTEGNQKIFLHQVFLFYFFCACIPAFAPCCHQPRSPHPGDISQQAPTGLALVPGTGSLARRRKVT